MAWLVYLYSNNKDGLTKVRARILSPGQDKLYAIRIFDNGTNNIVKNAKPASLLRPSCQRRNSKQRAWQKIKIKKKVIYFKENMMEIQVKWEDEKLIKRLGLQHLFHVATLTSTRQTTRWTTSTHRSNTKLYWSNGIKCIIFWAMETVSSIKWA